MKAAALGPSASTHIAPDRALTTGVIFGLDQLVDPTNRVPLLLGLRFPCLRQMIFAIRSGS